jgi:PiT family inorganic phosphate transporter
MALAWLVTLPAAAGVGAVAAGVVVHGGTAGIVLIAPAAVVVAGAIVVLSRRNPVHADNVNNARTTSVRPVTAGAGA